MREATQELREARTLAASAGDDGIAAKAQAMMVGVARMAGEDGVDQYSVAEDAVDLARRSGDRYALAQALNCFGIVLSSTDPEAARDLYVEAARVAREIGDERNAALFECNAAGMCLAVRRVDEAAEEATRAAAIGRRMRADIVEACALQLLAIAQVASGDVAASRSSAARVVALRREWRDETLLSEVLSVLAMAALADARRDAVTLWAAADRARGTMPVSPELQPDVEERLWPLRAGPSFADAWREGSELELDDALALGLQARQVA